MQDASSRLSEQINWRTIQFLLENSVFLLIGLQLQYILIDVARSSLGPAQIATFCVVALLAVIVVRPIWMFPVRYLLIKPVEVDGSASRWTASSSASTIWRNSGGSTCDAPPAEVTIAIGGKLFHPARFCKR